MLTSANNNDVMGQMTGGIEFTQKWLPKNICDNKVHISFARMPLQSWISKKKTDELDLISIANSCVFNENWKTLYGLDKSHIYAKRI